jgi:hydrogenase maturation protein HypF
MMGPARMVRRAIAVSGIVQGVGFRPFVHGLASDLQLSGFVVNTPAGVLIEVEGERLALERFERALTATPPPRARVLELAARDLAPRGDAGFRIQPSTLDEPSNIFISPDTATCELCLAELTDPSDRRYRYPFINCTACGPRLTIITGSPYDRAQTTMAAFEMCAACRAEYDDPRSRRFHAEAIACAVCGPRLAALDARGRPLATDSIDAAAAALAAGQIVALKGLGGFHLACDATNGLAVRELRRRKHRDDKPFALMVRDVTTAGRFCALDAREADALTSPERPIVLLHRAVEMAEIVDAAVAPGMNTLGVMLPYTPLHHLLMTAIDGRPLIMTSGNRSDEPIATQNDEAVERLSGIADLFLVHDRSIHVRCDDSVVHVVSGAPAPVRRSRGSAPAPVRLPFECPGSILAVGGQLKNTFAFGRGRDAFVSHHVGDLDDWLARQAYERDLALYAEALRVTPLVIAHDLHPDYVSTEIARRWPADQHVAVQHHHAHVASCMAEHLLTGPVIGVAWDGTGLGVDGAIWGGEFFVGDYLQMERVGHLRYVPLPGGDRAIREPWRMALAHLTDAGGVTPWPGDEIPVTTRKAIVTMIERGINTPRTSSAGRLFDAAASLCGLCHVASFEGQAAMCLESIAESSDDPLVYPFAIDENNGAMTVDTRPLIRAVADDCGAGIAAMDVARRFHRSLAAIIAAVCVRTRDRTGLRRVALSGGVFLNRLLSGDVRSALTARGFDVYEHRVVPPGDGGLSLGQLAVAAARVGAKES